MVQTDLSFTLSVLIPILFIVVLEIAGKARDVDLVRTLPDHRTRPRVGWSRKAEKIATRLPGFDTGQHIPRFGHFGTLHAVSLTLLLYGAGLVGYALNGATRNVLALSIAVMIGLLPIVSIEEYEDIDVTSRAPNSTRVHFAMLIPVTTSMLVGQAYAVGLPLWAVIPTGLVTVLSPTVLILMYFTVTLQRELQQLSG
jgi:hypothetical protein